MTVTIDVLSETNYYTLQNGSKYRDSCHMYPFGRTVNENMCFSSRPKVMSGYEIPPCYNLMT